MDIQNGRVDAINNMNYKSYGLFDENKKDPDSFNKEAIRNIHINNPLSTIFFSQQNIDALQEAIRYQVYIKSNKQYVIDKQSETEIFIIMRAYYLQHGKHLPYGLYDQVKELNQMVIDYCVPKVLNEISIYMHYKRDIQQLPIPMERGEFSSSKGTKVLVNKGF
jgi:hypothetical protein